MKDYYKILGVKEEATEEEIRAHWIELTKRYHPDLSKEGNVEERLKEINEAYHILKDQSTRFEYDLERTFKKMVLDKAQRRKERRKINIRSIMLSAGILVLTIIVGSLVLRWYRVAIPPKSEGLYEINRVIEHKAAPQIPPAKTEPNVKVEKEVISQEKTKIASVPPSPSLPSAEKESKPKEESAPQVVIKQEPSIKAVRDAPQEIQKEVSKEEPQEKTKIASAPPSPSLPSAEKESKPKEESAPQVVIKQEPPIKVVRDAPKEIPKEAPKETPKETPKEVTPISREPKEKLESPKEEEKKVPKEVGKVISQESVQIEKPKPTVIEPRPVSLLPPPLVKEEEVRKFFSNYIDRYVRKDINGFLSLFSFRAIQNQKDGFEAIRKTYDHFFDQSQELRYHMEGMKIEIYQNSVEVRARYRLDQIFKKKGEEKVWKGNIRWVLVKEDGVLKIISLDYEHEKSF